jgi:hypothetical protein
VAQDILPLPNEQASTATPTTTPNLGNLSRQVNKLASQVKAIRPSDAIAGGNWQGGGRDDTPAELATEIGGSGTVRYIKDVTVNSLDTRVQSAYQNITTAVSDLLPALRARTGQSREDRAFVESLAQLVAETQQVVNNPRSYIVSVHETGGRIRPTSSLVQEQMKKINRMLVNERIARGKEKKPSPASVGAVIRESISALQRKENFELGQVALGQTTSKRLRKSPAAVMPAPSYNL